MKDKAKLEDEKTKKEADEKDIKGVPDFWLTIFKVIKVHYIPMMHSRPDRPKI